jgi:uncharacterized protein (DUF433 family)
MSEHPRIEIDPAIMGGKPVIRGSRVTVEQVLRECARGATAVEIADQYPRLTPEDVAAALDFAADYLAHEIVVAAE